MFHKFHLYKMATQIHDLARALLMTRPELEVSESEESELSESESESELESESVSESDESESESESDSSAAAAACWAARSFGSSCNYANFSLCILKSRLHVLTRKCCDRFGICILICMRM